MKLIHHALIKWFGSLMLALILLAAMVLSLALAQGGLTLTRITDSGGSPWLGWQPDISIDGTKVAFSSNVDFLGQGTPLSKTFEIWLYDTVAMTYTRVTSIPAADWRDSYNPSVNDDGMIGAFESDADLLKEGRPYDAFEIWLYKINGATIAHTRITSASDETRDSYNPSINANGTKVVFESNSDFLGQGISTETYEIWLYDSTLPVTLTRVTIAAGSGIRESINPAINADGTKVVFESNSDFLGQGISAETHEVWLYDTAAMTSTRITTASTMWRDSENPSISADGTKIVFQSDSDFLNQGVEDGQHEIWLYDTDEMTYTRITTTPAATAAFRDSEYPHISADGTKIVFYSDADFWNQGIENDAYEIWLYDIAAMTLTRVSTGAIATGVITRTSFFPSINHDGTRVAFQSDVTTLVSRRPRPFRPAREYEVWLANTLDAPVLLNPANGTVTTSTELTLTWAASADAAGYRLDFNGIKSDVGNVTGYNTGALSNGVYTWTVAAYNTLSTSAYTDVWQFEVAATRPNLSISKVAAGEGGGTSNLPLNGVVTYTIVLSNAGDAAATGVAMSDALPVELAFGGWVQQNGAQRNGNIVSWTGIITEGNEVTVAFTATINSGSVLLGQTITNTVAFTSTNAGSGSDSAIVTVAGATNTPPGISNIADRQIAVNTSVAINFTITDVETPVDNLTLGCASSNTTLVPNMACTFDGTGENRTVTITPAAEQTGVATITLTVTDAGDLSDDTAFILTVSKNMNYLYLPLVLKD